MQFLWLVPVVVCLAMTSQLDFLNVEALVVCTGMAAVGFLRPRWTSKPPVFCAPLRALSRRPVLACVIPALLSLLLRLAMLPRVPAPHPVVPDEFSHLFLAKTFLLGRFANPGHPLWQHFETIHVISQPDTFSSMYLAGPAFFLAIGKLLTGEFFAGVLLATALFCMALTWFLRAYVPPGWALFGGVLAAVRFGTASYWNNSYWGGSVGALGGALVLGAYPRLVRRWTVGPALAFTAGAVILGNSRPYEGTGLLIVLGGGILFEYWKRRPSMVRLAPAIAAVAMVALVAGWAMTSHWRAVTGRPLTIPYQLNQQVYGWPMTLAWQHFAPVQYRHTELSQYRDYEQAEHQMITDPARWFTGALVKYGFLWRFYAGVSLSLGFLFTVPIVRARRQRIVWAAAGVVLLLVFTAQSGYPHYLSPIAAVVMLFLVQGLRRLSHTTSPAGPAIVRGLVPAMLLILAVRAVLIPPSPHASIAGPNYSSWCCADPAARDRMPLEQQITVQPGEHLVVVHYRLKAYDTFEWVYNEPDVDRARIVWARSMGSADRELYRYFPNRRVWHVEITDGSWRLLPRESPESIQLSALSD